MSSEGFSSKKRRRSSSNDDDDVSHHPNSKRAPSADYNPTTLNPSPTLDTNAAVPTTPVILDSSTPGDSMPDDDYVHHSFTSPPTGAPPATTHAQHTPPPKASKPARDAPYVAPLLKWDQISSLKFTAMKDGDIWYLISLTWHEKWKAACNPASKTQGREADEQVGPVDNSDIVDPDGELIPALSDGNRVTSVSQRVMELFTEWYGPPTHPIPRRVISEGNFSAKRIEFYPYKIKTYRMSKIKPHLPSSEPTHIISISRAAPVSELLAHVSAKWGNVTPARFWQAQVNFLELDPIDGIFYSSSRIEKDSTQPFAPTEEDKRKRLDESGLEDGDAIIMETKHGEEWTIDLETTTLGQRINRPKVQEPKGPVFSEEQLAKYRGHRAIKPDVGSSYSTNSQPASAFASTAYTTPVTTSSYNRTLVLNGRSSVASSSRPVAPGTVGLNNLGNTCFMNSALQCLAHAPELLDYFLVGVYRDEINRDNPLGMGGAIAEVFGVLLDQVWHPTNYCFAPRQFKSTLQRFAPQFSGYAQHDTQEFLAFLLDGLHEDLNRVLKKPYVENPDWNGGGSKELVQHAKTAWEGYKKRNDSVIVDLFQGQYKSTLVCPECNKVSITFDPFMYLTLPLPVQKFWNHVIHWVPWSSRKPRLKVPIQLPRDASCKDMKKLFFKWFETPVENQLCVELFSNKIYKYWDDHNPVSDIGERDIMLMYELPCPSGQGKTSLEEDAPFFPLPVLHQSGFGVTAYGRPEYKGVPFMVVIPSEELSNEEAIYRRLVERYTAWTENSEDLYRRQASTNATTPDSMPARSTAPTDDGIDIDTVEAKDIAEMDPNEDQDADMVVVPPQTNKDTESIFTETEDESDPTEVIGPQADLFTIKAFAGNDVHGATSMFIHDPKSTVETLATRAKLGLPSKRKTGWKWIGSTTPEPEEPGKQKQLVSVEDTIVCEWDPHFWQLFFGVGKNPQENVARWDRWELFEHPEYVAAMTARKATKDQGIRIEDCLDEFTKEEKLGEEDPWYCPRCKKHQQASKKFELWKVPDILVVHLKRFSNSRLLRDKIDSFIDFPIEGLDLTERVGERQVAKQWIEEGNAPEALGIQDDGSEALVYDLFAVDEHMGGLGGGHYRAYAKNFEDNHWYHFDDTHTSLSDARHAVNANAYLLFYRRRTSKPLGGQTREKTIAAKAKGLPSVQGQPVQPASTPSASKSITDYSPPDTFRNSGPVMSYGATNQNPFEENMLDGIGGHSFSEAPPEFDDTENDEILESGITGNLYGPFSEYGMGIGNRGLRGSPSSSMEARSVSSLENEPREMDWGENDNDADGEPELVDADDGIVEQFIEVKNREDEDEDLYSEPVATAQQSRLSTTPKRPVPPPPVSALTTRESSAASPEVGREGAPSPSPEPTAVS